MRFSHWLPTRRPKREKAHYLRDYSRLVSTLLGTTDRVRAMHDAVGGHFAALGMIEAALLDGLGLENGQMIVDVGCGSGRLASALATAHQVDYLGTDIVPDLLDFARENAPAHYRFALVDSLQIPSADETADFVVFFSVMTHLMHHESFLYLEEAKRVARPGGRIVVSFLELGAPSHWPIFASTAAEARAGTLAHLNAFVEVPVWRLWAERLGLIVEQVIPAEAEVIRLGGSVTFDHGQVRSGMVSFGQSLLVLRKPMASEEVPL